MIKVNLLATKATRKKGATATQFILIVLAVLAVEALALYFWYANLNSARAAAEGDIARLKAKVEALQKVKQEIAETEKLRGQLEAQNYILDELKDGKVGPPNMLLFLSYALSNPPNTLAHRAEQKALERAGWNLQWDPDSVWLHRLQERDDGVLTFYGEARGHEDAAEFARRLRTSAYLTTVEPGIQERAYDQGIEMKYIAFRVTADLNYAVAPVEVPSTETVEDAPPAAPEGAPPAAPAP